MSKAQEIADQYGESIFSLIEEAMFNGICPGICMNPDCNATYEYEPDCRSGWCDECETNTVESLPSIVGMI